MFSIQPPSSGNLIFSGILRTEIIQRDKKVIRFLLWSSVHKDTVFRSLLYCTQVLHVETLVAACYVFVLGQLFDTFAIVSLFLTAHFENSRYL